MSQGRSDGSVLISAKITEEVFKKGLAAMQRELNSFSSSAISDFSTLSKGSDAFGASLGRAAKTAAGLAAAYLSVSKIVSGISAGVQLNANLQEAQIGIASVLATTNKYIDAQGVALQGQEAFNAAMRQSKEIAREIDLATKTTVANEIQLLQAVQATLSTASQQGAGTKETVKFLADLGNAMNTFQLDLNNLGREAFALLSGTNLGQSALFQRLKGLGISDENIKSWIKAGTLIDNVTVKLGAFSAAGEEMAKTFAGRSRDLESSLAGIAEIVTKDLTQSLGEAKTVISELFYNPETFALSDEIEPLVKLVQDFVSAFGRNALDAANSFADSMKSLSGFVDRNRRDIDSLGQSAKSLAGYWDIAAVALIAYATAQKVSTSETLKSVAAQAQSAQAYIASTKATLQQAQAEQAAALAAVNETKAQIAKIEALRASALASTNAAEADLARAAVNKQLSILNANLVANEARYAAALNATAAASGKASLAGRALAGIKSAASGVVNLLGGPWMAAFTIGATAVYTLWSKMQQAGAEGKRLRDALRDAGDEAEKTSEKTDKLNQSLALAAQQRAEEALEKEKQTLKEAGEALENYSASLQGLVSMRAQLPFAKQNEATAAAADVLDRLNSKQIDIHDAYKELIDIQGRFANELKKKNTDSTIFEGLLESVRTVLGGMKLVANEQDNLNKATDRYNQSLGKAGQTTTSTANASKELANALRKVDEAQKIATPEDAIKFLDNLTKNTTIAKQASIDLSKAKAQEAIAMLEAAIATEQDADVKANAIKRLEAYKAALAAPDFKWDTSGTKKELMSLTDFTKKFRTELNAMQGVAGSEFTKGLNDGLKSLRSELEKVKGVTKEVREGFEQEFTFAFADKSIRAAKMEMLELNGQFADLAKLEIDEKVANYTEALKNASPAAKEAAASTEQYKAALEKRVALDNLQEQVSFFKELAGLSGNYGLSLEYQNRLIEIQAEKYKALFAKQPELQKFVDEWERLAKLEIDPSFEAGFSRAAQKYTAEWTNAAKIAEKTFDVTISGMENIGMAAFDALFDNAEFRADKLLRDIAKQMMQIMMNQAIGGAMKALFFSDGGYTGDGNPSDPAGIVHKREYVLTAATTSAVGVDTLNALQASKSIAAVAGTSSSLSGAAMFVAEQRKATLEPILNVNITNEMGREAEVTAQQTPSINGGMNLEVLVKRITRNDFASGGMDSVMRNRFGVRTQVVGR